ncbi:MAG: hypothetical protein AAF512_11640 [Pseudomonadota bacterium]
MTDQTKVDFASAAWVDEARKELENLVSNHGEDGKNFSVCEIFTDAPKHVAESGTAAWYFYITGKTVKVGAGEINDADVTIRADYTETLPTARLVYTPEILAERAAQPPDENSSNVEGDMSQAPPYLVELHNQLAVMTA